MNIVEETVTDFQLPDTSAGRSAGVHLSSIIRCIATETGILKPEWCEELSLVDIRDMSKLPIQAQLRIHAGFAWESHYIPLLKDVVDHPGEMHVDGIYMTPDGESLDVIITQKPPYKPAHRMKIHEVKATYKSVNTVKGMNPKSRSNWMWLTQTKAYCKGANTTLADLHVMFWCGDYKWPITPQLRIYHLEFTEKEIEDNWTLLTEYRDQRLIIEGGANV